MADRIVIMKDGHIQQIGTPSEVYHSPANTFVARFIGSPAMNMLPGAVVGGQVQLNGGGAVPAALRDASDRAVTLGIRPEDLQTTEGTGLITGRVQVREPLGHETLIYVGTPGGDIIAKADGRNPPDVGSEVSLSAAPETLHIFDAETGMALR